MAAPLVAICCDLHDFRCNSKPCCRRCPDKPSAIGGALADLKGFLELVDGRKARTSEAYRKEYLTSPHWKAVRRRKIANDGANCQGCGVVATSNDVHHLTYKNFGHERDEDLQVLCRRCHDEEHHA